MNKRKNTNDQSVLNMYRKKMKEMEGKREKLKETQKGNI